MMYNMLCTCDDQACRGPAQEAGQLGSNIVIHRDPAQTAIGNVAYRPSMTSAYGAALPSSSMAQHVCVFEKAVSPLSKMVQIVHNTSNKGRKKAGFEVT